MRKFYSIDQIKEANEAAGKYWFSPDTLAFFDSQIHDEVYDYRYFITSEKGPDGVRYWTIREVKEDGAEIATVGWFQQFDSYREARDAVIVLMRTGKLPEPEDEDDGEE